MRPEARGRSVRLGHETPVTARGHRRCPALRYTPTPQTLWMAPRRPGHVLSRTSDRKTGKEEEACKQGGRVATEPEAQERPHQTES